jgi:transitional endoplasmic reticulum ATPase
MKKDEMTARDCDVARSEDGKIYLPKAMTYDEGVLWLQRKKREENEVVGFQEMIQCFPPDGAVAFAKAMKERFGWTSMVATPGFFGANPPVMIDVAIGPYESIKVPWGRFEIPGIDGYIQTGVGEKEGQTVFALNGQVKQKHYHILAELAKLTQQFVDSGSIYRGQAIKVDYVDDGEFGNMNAPTFLDLTEVDAGELTFSSTLDQAIKDYVFTPIQFPDECEEAGVPVKRGILMFGGYGTGKTLTAYVAAQKCVAVDRTFIYLKDVRHLAQALDFAKQYSPAVVFAEDIDRAVQGQDRTKEVDKILNTLDGVDSKQNKVMVILTTNHVDEVNKALLRPGRIDLALEITPPDAAAVEKLVRIYGRGLIDDKADLTEVGEALDGYIPAVIREAVERSKLSAVSRLSRSPKKGELTTNDLLIAAATLTDQIKLLNAEVHDPSRIEVLGERLGYGIGVAMSDAKRHEEITESEISKRPAHLKDANGEATSDLRKKLRL